MVDALERMQWIPPAFCHAAWHALRPRFETRSEHGWMRCQALRGALLVVQNDPGLIRRLQASILDVDARDDVMYLRHVAKVAEQISVERKIPEGSSVENYVITARIQARRKTPHALRYSVVANAPLFLRARNRSRKRQSSPCTTVRIDPWPLRESEPAE